MFLYKKIVVIFIVITTFIINGCATKLLFMDKNYTEKVASVLISEDNKNLVIITPEYHYIFGTDSEFTSILKSPMHKYLSASISNFYVSSKGITTGSITLSINSLAPKEIENIAIQQGFNKRPDLFTKIIELKGMRYASNGILPKLESQKLNQEYKINVIAEQSTGEKATKVLLTPITLPVDGVLVIGGAALIAIGIVVIPITFGVMCHGEQHCLN